MTPLLRALLPLALTMALALTFVRTGKPQHVELRRTAGGWSLIVNGASYRIKGVTFSATGDTRALDEHLAVVARLGANTIRTWVTGPETRLLLDAAQRHGVKVVLGLWLRHGRPGAEDDDAFDWQRDARGQTAQLADALAHVKALRGHPALLMWTLGNEVILNTNPEAVPAYARFLESACRAVKQADPRHPVGSVEATDLAWATWAAEVPCLDFYGANVYGPDVRDLPRRARASAIDRPYLVTELGVDGEWAVAADARGVRREPGEDEKFAAIVAPWRDVLEPDPACLGAMVFNYDIKLDYVGMWLGLRVGDAYRPRAWGVREAFTGQAPSNRWPEIKALRLATERVRAGEWLEIAVDVRDPEGEPVEVTFYGNLRDGASRDDVVPLPQERSSDGSYRVRAPDVEGALKVYAFARDTYPNLAVAHASVFVDAR